MPNDQKKDLVQQLIIIGFSVIPIWDIFFNRNVFNIYHLGLAILMIITVFDKFKLDNLNIKIPGLIEIAESNKEINRNIEKIVNKIQIDTSAKANATGSPISFNFNGKPYNPKEIKEEKDEYIKI